MSNKEEIEDFQMFGDCYVYCNQHLNVHKTGWCTVSVRNKISLGKFENTHQGLLDALNKAEEFGLKIYKP